MRCEFCGTRHVAARYVSTTQGEVGHPLENVVTVTGVFGHSSRQGNPPIPHQARPKAPWRAHALSAGGPTTDLRPQPRHSTPSLPPESATVLRFGPYTIPAT
jgi:hypothetical protein